MINNKEKALLQNSHKIIELLLINEKWQVFAVCVYEEKYIYYFKNLFKYYKKSLQLIEIKYIIEYIYVCNNI